MKKVVFYCDMCGRAIWADEWYKIMAVKVSEKGMLAGTQSTLVSDVCTDCAKEIEGHFIKLQDKMHNTGPLDTDKIIALYTAGWQVARIAEEMKTTAAKVNYILKKEGKKK